MRAVKNVTAHISGIFLALLLLLLSIGLPVTYNAVNKMKSDIAHHKASDNNPYSNATEEKTPCNNIVVNEEYVHDVQYDFTLSFFQISTSYIHAHEALYLAYHGELHCPPPNILS